MDHESQTIEIAEDMLELESDISDTNVTTRSAANTLFASGENYDMPHTD
jgi:hypothetical protein